MTLKKPEPLEAVRRRAASDPWVIYEFYDLLEKINISEPKQVWNCDETGFCTDQKKKKSACRDWWIDIQGQGKENITALACVSANGDSLSPFLIFPGQRLWSNWKGKNALQGTMYAHSDKGWMTTIIFEDFFRHFCNTILIRPLLLIFDGHISHLSSATIQLAIKENVTHYNH